jgi:hypothetical protein
VIRASGHVSLVDSIVAEATAETFDFAGNNNAADHNIDFILTNPNDATVNGLGFVLRGAPNFVDAANRDYHLRPYSPGLDVAPSVSNSRDLDGRLRDLDLPQINNVQGPRDLGAYELQSIPACSRARSTVLHTGSESLAATDQIDNEFAREFGAHWIRSVEPRPCSNSRSESLLAT